MKTTELSRGVQTLLAGCPTAGNGVNHWLFKAACELRRAEIPESNMENLLRIATNHCGRVVKTHEIERAIKNSGIRINGGSTLTSTPKWPQVSPELVRAIVRGGNSLEQMRQMSPIKWTNGEPHTEEIIDLLFPGNPMLCVAQTKFRFSTMPRDAARGLLALCQFIVPSPMSKVFGMTKDGKPSKHTLDNTGPRRFLIIEFDTGTFDAHAAILLHLAQYEPLVMAVHSGSKSLHGWFFVHNQAEAKTERFFRYAVALGADSQLWVRSQFVRIPDGMRENGKRQSVIYFNPPRY